MRHRRFLQIAVTAALVLATTTAFAKKPDTLNRDEIPESYKWDLSDIYPSWEAWETDLAKIQGYMDQYVALRGTLKDGPQQLEKAELLSDSLGMLVGRIYRYPGLMSSADTRNNEIQARLQQVGIMMARFGQSMAWFTPELLEIPQETVMGWVDASPILNERRMGYESLYRNQEHVLDAAGEQIMSYSGPATSAAGDIYSKLSTADIEWPTVTLSDGSEVVCSPGASSAILHTCRVQEDRHKVQEARAELFDKKANTYAAIYNGILQDDWFSTQVRKYNSTAEMYLKGKDIPVEVLTNLLDAAKKGNAPLQRYHKLRKEALGLDTYRYADGFVPIADVEWPFYYEDIREDVIKSLKIYGKEYQKTANRAFDERWFDVYESDGKRAGAFSAGVYGVHPYMLLNYADTMNDAFTLAHELGHTMHTVLSFANQPYHSAQYTIFVAEVASTMNEALFLDLLLEKTKDPQKRIVLLQHAIDSISGTFFIQCMFADFEYKAHQLVEQGQPVTADVLQQLYLQSMEEFYGDALDNKEVDRNTWARIGHIFRSPYYVYQYATSLCASSQFHQMATEGKKKDRKAAMKSYINLLKSGGNDYPINQLKKAGVDMTTTAPVEALIAHMDDLVGQLEVELRKTGMIE